MHGGGGAGMFRGITGLVRRSTRSLYYRTPIGRWCGFGGPRSAQNTSGEWWNSALAGPFASYLEERPTNMLRNALVRTLIQVANPNVQSLLDAGCGNGSLAWTEPRCARYVGIDISSTAIEAARRQLSEMGGSGERSVEYHVSSLDGFTLPDAQVFDAIVFSEVLYYLDPDAALSQASRYVRSLRSGGVLAVSLKNDAKSLLIFRLLQSRLDWVTGVLYQQKEAAEYKVRWSMEDPAFVVGIFRDR